MSKELLFDSIRKEEVVICAGAGTSLYAGYPDGKRLTEIIYSKFTDTERNLVDATSKLDEISEQFLNARLNSRNDLTRVLKETFIYKRPNTIDWHERFAKIPHFKIILTTNYDNLFELGFKDKAQKVVNSSDLASMDKKRPSIFKIHGDLSSPDSIIIAKSHYINFFKSNQENSVYWTSVKHYLSNNAVLFIGYNLEDPNIRVIFERISEELGQDRNNCFFIAPNLNELRVRNLIKQGIHYINMDSETFLCELQINLNDNLVTDFQEEKVSVNTFREFVNNIDGDPHIEAKNGKLSLVDIKGFTNPFEKKLLFNLDSKAAQNLINNLKKNSFEKVELNRSEVINHEFRIGQLKLPHIDFSKIQIVPHPHITALADISFENGDYFNNIPIKVFVKNRYIEIHPELKTSKVIIAIIANDEINWNITFTVEHNKLCSDFSTEINEAKLLENVARGIPLQYNIPNYKPGKHSFEFNGEFAEAMAADKFVFEGLAKIEKHFNVVIPFPLEYEMLGDEAIVLIETLMAIIDKGYYDQDCDIIETKLKPGRKIREEAVEALMSNNYDPLFPYSEEEIIDAFGTKINLGYKTMQVLEGYVSNPRDLKKDNFTVKFKSRINKLRIRYLKNPLPDLVLIDRDEVDLGKLS